LGQQEHGNHGHGRKDYGNQIASPDGNPDYVKHRLFRPKLPDRDRYNRSAYPTPRPMIAALRVTPKTPLCVARYPGLFPRIA
jgi:hypothetical protein